MSGRSSLAPRQGILDIESYQPGRSTVAGGGPVIKLSSNETPLGPSPATLAAYQAAASTLERYPDRSATALREAIADFHGLDADRIVAGAGSDELLSLLAQTYLGEGDEAIHTEHGFLIYKIIIQAAGALPVVAPEIACRADVASILAKVSDRTKCVFLANPNNPTGTYLSADDIRRLRAELPAGALLVLDAAYAEYVQSDDYEAGAEMVADHDNVVMTRTFSKIYGLAGLRVGWAYCPEAIADALNRIRGPFNVSGPAIAAGVAAINDGAHRDRAVALNSEQLPLVAAKLVAMGLQVTPSVANFLLVHFPETEGKSAAEADAFLTARGILLRRVENYGFPNALRATIGTADDNEAVVSALGEFMKAQG